MSEPHDVFLHEADDYRSDQKSEWTVRRPQDQESRVDRSRAIHSQQAISAGYGPPAKNRELGKLTFDSTARPTSFTSGRFADVCNPNDAGPPSNSAAYDPWNSTSPYHPSYRANPAGRLSPEGDPLNQSTSLGHSSPTCPNSDDNAPSIDDPDEMNCRLYTSFASLAYTGGTTPSAGYGEVFVPLLQNHTNLLYGDLRGLFNNQSAWLGSFGGGLRTLIADSLILGGYAYYDYYDSELKNRFQQSTIGVELLTWRWEARSNGYVGLSKGDGNYSGNGSAFLQNGQIYLPGFQQSAMSGIDGECGALLAADRFAQKELRAFAGGYFFNGQSGGPDVQGVSARLEARFYDLDFLGEGSRLEVGVISTYDDVYQLQVTALVNVRIALGRPSCPRGLTPLERRMLDRPVRRHVVQTSQSQGDELATAYIDGNPKLPIIELHPGADLTTSVENAPNNSLILLEGGTYSVPTGVEMNPGQAIVGGGSQVSVVGNNSGRIGFLTVPGSRPTIDRPNPTGYAVEMNSDTAIIGTTITGGQNPLYADNVNHLLISDVVISNASGDGVYFDEIDGFKMDNVLISQTGGLGARLYNVNNSLINGLTISQTTGSALYYNCGTNVHLNGLDVDATGANDDAVRIHTQTQSVFTNFNIRNSTHDAITIGSSTNVTFDQIATTNIVGNGFMTDQSGTFTLAHFNMTGVGGSGVVLDNTPLVSLDNSTFTNVNNVISFLNTEYYISGNNNVATGFNTLFTGTTTGGFIQFTTPNATAP